MDYEKLRKDIARAARDYFSMFHSKHSTEQICGYALYSDADASSLAPAINTTPHLREKQADDPDDGAYYKWSPAEWSHEDEDGEAFDEISDALFAAAANLSKAERAAHRRETYEACVAGLETLVNEGFFAKGSSDYVVVFAISDTEERDSEIRWISRLNNDVQARDFAKWIRSL